MNVKLNVVLVLAVTTLLITVKSVADAAVYPATPGSVVERYLALDAEGAWFTSSGRAELQKYTRDQIDVATIIAPTLITTYKVVQISSADDQALVQIEYRVVGYSENLANFQPKNEIVRNTVNVKKLDGRWTLQTQIFPHVKWESVIKQIEAAERKSLEYLNAIDDDKKRRKLEAQIKQENLFRDDLIKRITQHVRDAARKNNSIGTE